MIKLSVLHSKTQEGAVWQVSQQDNFPLSNCHLLCNYDIPAILMLRQFFFFFSAPTRENFRNASDLHYPTALVIYCCVTNYPKAWPRATSTYILSFWTAWQSLSGGLLWAFCEETGWRYGQVKGSLQGRSHNCQTPQRLLLPPEAPDLPIQATAYGCTWHGSFLPSVGHKDRWKQLLIKLRLPWIMGCQRHSTTSPIKPWTERLLQWGKRWDQGVNTRSRQSLTNTLETSDHNRLLENATRPWNKTSRNCCHTADSEDRGEENSVLPITETLTSCWDFNFFR